MSEMRQKLKLAWICKGNLPRLEPRVLVEDAAKFHHAAMRRRSGTEYRDPTPRNLSRSIGIETVKFQHGYGHPGKLSKQMCCEVVSVALMDADDHECDPCAIARGCHKKKNAPLRRPDREG